jgi:hypothetical protein
MGSSSVVVTDLPCGLLIFSFIRKKLVQFEAIMKAKSIEVLRFFIFHSIHFYLQQITTLYKRGLQDTKK